MLAAHKSGLVLVSGLILAVALTSYPAVQAATTRHAQQEQQPAASPTITTTRPVNIRSGPGTSYRILTTAQAGETYTITGKNADATWWRINYRGQAAWVFARLVQADGVENVPLVLIRAPKASPSTVGSAASGTPAAASGSAVGGPAASAPSQPAGPTSISFDPQQFQFKLQKVYTGLNQPTFVTNAGDGSGRMFVLERAGRVKVFAAPGTEPSSDGQMFLDIEDKVDDSGPEQGLLGLAFDPGYKTNGFFYVDYTDNAGDTVVARYRVSDDPNRADKESEKQLLWVDQPAPNHNGGMLAFGSDGRLWVGLGDGGGANDTFGNGQNPNTPLGKIVRIDVREEKATTEIWATGLRNPWRFSFDRKTGDLWIADVGQDLFEEIDYVPPALVTTGGLNFGWPIMEGAHCRGDTACNTDGLQLPVWEYGHAGNGCSVTGGSVYRGQAYSALQGVYLYGDFCSGNIWAFWRGTDGTAHNALVLPNAAAMSSFGEDEAGELYIADFGGFVHRIVATTP